jgi:hypothetical protein
LFFSKIIGIIIISLYKAKLSIFYFNRRNTQMKTKRILAAIIAAAAAFTMTATMAFAEGLESDDVTLDDEPAASAEEEEVVVPEEETPVAPAPNPATGNSAVALAVVPVALAAAAIVAKKRK